MMDIMYEVASGPVWFLIVTYGIMNTTYDLVIYKEGEDAIQQSCFHSIQEVYCFTKSYNKAIGIITTKKTNEDSGKVVDY